MNYKAKSNQNETITNSCSVYDGLCYITIQIHRDVSETPTSHLQIQKLGLCLLRPSNITETLQCNTLQFNIMTHTENEIEQEYEIIKYALTFLLSNLDDDTIKDMSDCIGDTDKEEVESLLNTIIDNY